MKILTVLGARPQFVKASAVSRAIESAEGVSEVIVHTGQHFDEKMSDIFFKEMEIQRPKYNLDINNMSHGAMTAEMLKKIEEILLVESPDWVLVYGDTNSTLAGALAAVKLHIKIAHVEAGLRSFNNRMPEEINRILTDRISSILFCPTDLSVMNLSREGIDKQDHVQIVKCGDVMKDVALYYEKIASEKNRDTLKGLDDKFVLCTVHRAENTDDLARITSIIEGLNKLNEKIQVVLPLHPRTKNVIEKHNLKCNFKIINPVGYFDMINLITNSDFVLTDSGGLQKEAFFFKKNCIVLRDETEWVELIDNGLNKLVGACKDSISNSDNVVKKLCKDFTIELYGNGHSSELIIQKMKEYQI